MTTRLVSGGADVAALMAVGGWLSPKNVLFYAKILPETAEASYRAAMERLKQGTKQPAEKVMSLEEYVASQASPKSKP
jgi:hypothetical protein